MKKYGKLLTEIAYEWEIFQGASENDDAWKARLIYSVAGRMAYAAMHDDTDDSNTTSIVHVNERIIDILDSYTSIYPETCDMFGDFQDIQNEIYNILLDTGQMYHIPNRIAPAAPHVSESEGIVFTRGMPLTEPDNVGGIGSYNIRNRHNDLTVDVYDMFGLQKNGLQTVWDDIVSEAKWSPLSTNLGIEYLRMTPPFTSGYWVIKPYREMTSICRIGPQWGRIYYLYKMESDKLMVSQLPEWFSDGRDYLTAANACLNEVGNLPPTDFHQDGSLIYVRLNYLMPPAELSFIKLYSWPISFEKFPCDFNRCLTDKVFFAIKSVLEKTGYKFIEE